MSGEVFAFGGEVRGFVVLVHGGAGNVPEERRAAHAGGCRAAARVAGVLLAGGGAALDAVEAAVRALEDDPLFNAGTGACLNEDGNIEHDASIMDGRDLGAGAIAAMSGFAAPISVARAALDDGKHILYAGDGARSFALAHGFSAADEASLVTDAARKALAAVREGSQPPGWAGGTVGAVALDAKGHVAAATSTGGTVNKRRGRVGDSPIIGAGTYADDECGAVSTTGQGEAMIRLVIAKAVCDSMRSGRSPSEAASSAIGALARRLSATGGIIAVRPGGAWGFARSTATMSWAAVWEGGEDAGV